MSEKETIKKLRYIGASIDGYKATIAAQAKELRRLKFGKILDFVNDPKFKDMSALLTKKDREIKRLKTEKCMLLRALKNTDEDLWLEKAVSYIDNPLYMELQQKREQARKGEQEQ